MESAELEGGFFYNAGEIFMDGPKRLRQARRHRENALRR
jgi:hypothetical protein